MLTSEGVVRIEMDIPGPVRPTIRVALQPRPSEYNIRGSPISPQTEGPKIVDATLERTLGPEDGGPLAIYRLPAMRPS